MAVAIASIYEAYAPVYDAIGQARFSEWMAGQTLRRLAGTGPRPARVLDLACGTGAAALLFAAAGCDVAGVDRSAPMLEIARGRARDAGYAIAFVQGDIRDLPTIGTAERAVSRESHLMAGACDLRPAACDLAGACDLRPAACDLAGACDLRPATCDLVTCFYDSLNYLAEDGDLDRVFAGAAEALRPGGRLVFDLNTEAEYATWDERDAVTYDSPDCLVYNKLSYDRDTRLATGRIVWFVREIERWWRGEETHVERAWADGEVRAALAGAGLALAARLDVEGRPAAEDAPRVVYVARRLNGEGAEAAKSAESGFDCDTSSPS